MAPKTVYLEYIGPSDVREISTEDFTNIGAEGVEGIRVVKAVNPVVELPEPVAAWLIEHDKDLGTVMHDGQEEEIGVTTTAWKVVDESRASVAKEGFVAPGVPKVDMSGTVSSGITEDTAEQPLTDPNQSEGTASGDAGPRASRTARSTKGA